MTTIEAEEDSDERVAEVGSGDAFGESVPQEVHFIRASEVVDLGRDAGCRTPPRNVANSIGDATWAEGETGSSEHHRIKHAFRRERSGERNTSAHKVLKFSGVRRAFGKLKPLRKLSEKGRGGGLSGGGVPVSPSMPSMSPPGEKGEEEGKESQASSADKSAGDDDGAPQGDKGAGMRAWLGNACVAGCFAVAALVHDRLLRKAKGGGHATHVRWKKRRDWSRAVTN